jgi:hypothetical protein
MQLGTELTTHNCARCHNPLTVPVVYRDHTWWHAHCWQEGEHQLAYATHLATAFEFQSHLPMLHNLSSDLL